jgi:hypothetical protein
MLPDLTATRNHRFVFIGSNHLWLLAYSVATHMSKPCYGRQVFFILFLLTVAQHLDTHTFLVPASGFVVTVFGNEINTYTCPRGSVIDRQVALTLVTVEEGKL